MCPMMTSIDDGTEHQIWNSLERRWPYATYRGFGQSLSDHTVPRSLQWFPYPEVFDKCDSILYWRCRMRWTGLHQFAHVYVRQHSLVEVTSQALPTHPTSIHKSTPNCCLFPEGRISVCNPWTIWTWHFAQSFAPVVMQSELG